MADTVTVPALLVVWRCHCSQAWEMREGEVVSVGWCPGHDQPIIMPNNGEPTQYVNAIPDMLGHWCPSVQAVPCEGGRIELPFYSAEEV